MEYKNPRKYNTSFRKKIINKIDLLKNNDDYIQIYYMVTNDIGNNYSSNRNGIFVNMNILSDDCIEELVFYLEKKLNYKLINEENDNDNDNNNNNNNKTNIVQNNILII